MTTVPTGAEAPVDGGETLSSARQRPTRVVFVNENLGGHATMHLGLAKALRDHPAIEPTFLDVPAPGLLRRAFGAPIPGLARLDLDLQPFRYQLGQSAHAWRLLQDHLEADVFHLYTQNIALLSTRQLRRRPVVVSADATNTQGAYRLPYRRPTRFTPLPTKAVRQLERRVFEMADVVVTHSAWAASSVCDYGIESSRVQVIPFGIDVPELPTREATAVPEITFVGATMARKGGWWLLDVYRRRLAGRCVLNIVTKERVPNERGVRVFNNVRPGAGGLAPILARTAVFVFPTQIDPFGYAAIEAMSMALPVVANRVGAVPEIVADGETGILVAAKDEDRFVEAVLTLLGDADLQRRMGELGRRRVLERFDARITTAELVDVLHAVSRSR